MIVVCGLLADEPLRMLCGRLSVLGYPYAFLNELAYPASIECRQVWSKSGSIEGFFRTEDGKAVDFGDVTGVYVRYADFRSKRHLSSFTEQEKQLIKAERSLSFSYLFDYLPCVVVNPLRNMLSNDSKPFQSLVARAHGFEVPKTLITSDPGDAREFFDLCGGQVIYKALGGTRSIVRRMEPGDLARLDLIVNCPVQFQEFVPGVNTRVHVVGEAVFAVRIYTPEVDYRYAANRYEACALPPAIQRRCIEVTRHLGLWMSGIDLIDSDGRFYCLEVNPSPAYSFYERNAFQPISTALAELLRLPRR